MRAVLVASFLVVAGCNGPATDIEPSLVFADRSDLEIVRLINAAAGTDLFATEGQVNQFGNASATETCPAVAVEGNVATVTGGCTTADGMTIDGSVIVTNPFGWDQIESFEFGSPTIYEADELTLTFGAQPPQIFDGIIRRTDSLTNMDGDITVTQLEIAVRSDLSMRCTADPSRPSCTFSGGIELIGAGGAHVTGSTTVDRATGAQTLELTLQGEDRLIVERVGTCLGWSIEGTDRGMTCP